MRIGKIYAHIHMKQHKYHADLENINALADIRNA